MHQKQQDHRQTLAHVLESLASSLASVEERVAAAISRAVLAYERGQRRDALLLRLRWKAADRPKLLAYGFDGVAQRRLQALKGGRGRPVVRDFRSAPEAVASLAAFLEQLFAPSTPRHERRHLLKQTPFWPPLLESVLEGERAAERRVGARNPAERARRLVGSRLGMSESSVTAVVSKLRRDRAAGRDLSVPTSMRLDELERWLDGAC